MLKYLIFILCNHFKAMLLFNMIGQEYIDIGDATLLEGPP